MDNTVLSHNILYYRYPLLLLGGIMKDGTKVFSVYFAVVFLFLLALTLLWAAAVAYATYNILTRVL
ncbi:hypothetical protein LCGC14_1347700 [marine sediment metagenome]|uniref:Uncharacterized protein n=1 Tax=marine sediment metagenome TaxID=412755 RepID=A0A0F9KXU3_9ZZZZ